MEMAGNKFLMFELCGEYYAVSVHATREIIRMMEITGVPKAPPFIKGVINLRGKILPVIDLRVKFGLDEKPYDDKTCIIIIEINEEGKSRLMGVVVDTVLEVLVISDGEIEATPEFSSNAQMDFLHGIAKICGKVVWLLNLDKIVSSEELVVINKLKEEF
jgi:purine-binding chemotaxis protein CheW